jgi:hypothetical protein
VLPAAPQPLPNRPLATAEPGRLATSEPGRLATTEPGRTIALTVIPFRE